MTYLGAGIVKAGWSFKLPEETDIGDFIVALENRASEMELKWLKQTDANRLISKRSAWIMTSTARNMLLRARNGHIPCFYPELHERIPVWRDKVVIIRDSHEDIISFYNEISRIRT